MARKKKPAAEKRPPKAVKTSLKGLLEDVTLEAPKARPQKPAKRKRSAEKPAPPAEPPPPTEGPRPSDGLTGDDRIAYYSAIAGVRPLRGAAPPTRAKTKAAVKRVPAPTTGDDVARARLAALVAGGVRFELDREDERVRGRRAGVAPSVDEQLGRRGVAVAATLDLHGMTGREAEQEVARFVRRQQRRGARRVCIVHGKGTHSEGGVGVLQQHAVRALTEGGAAPVVVAFSSAAVDLGGSGALVVQLER